MKNKSSLVISFSIFWALFFVSFSAYGISFSTADIAGEWSGYFLESKGKTSYWIFGKLTVNQEGNVTGGRWEAVSGTKGEFVDGAISITNNGILSGTIRTREDGSLLIDTMTLTHGKMDRGKDLVQGVVLKDNGFMDSITLIRQVSSTFTTEDLVGDWLGFLHNTNGGTHDNWTMDLRTVAGGTTTGTWNSIQSSESGTLTGSLALNRKGSIANSSALTSAGDVVSTIRYRTGMLMPGKSLFAAVDFRDTGYMDIGFYLKADKTGYKTKDLKGTWAGYFSEISAGGSVYWIYGSLTLNGKGKCVAGEWESFQGTKGTFTGGNLTLDINGKITGNLTSNDGRIMTIQSGLMDSGKTMAAAVANKDNGNSDLAFFIKMEPDFPWIMFLPSFIR